MPFRPCSLLSPCSAVAPTASLPPPNEPQRHEPHAGLIMLAFGALYAVLAGYQTGMLFAALGIRGDDYR